MGTDIVPIPFNDAFTLAEHVSKSTLIPAAYRNKAADVAIAVMYGSEIGLPPMTSLQRIVVVDGKPTLDAQGMVSLIRRAGHSLSGEMTPDKATATGKRRDTGDSMTVTWTLAKAKAIGLANKKVWKDYPEAMLWARCVTQLARALFADVIMGVTYAPEEADFAGTGPTSQSPPRAATGDVEASDGHLDNGAVVDRPASADPPADAGHADEEIADAELVEEPETVPDFSAMSMRELTELLKAKGGPLTGPRAGKEAWLRGHFSVNEDTAADAEEDEQAEMNACSTCGEILEGNAICATCEEPF